jgi:hemoglobin/transferrin/lactoferrin receptor protein
VDWTLVDDKESKDLPDDSDFAPHGFGLLDLSAYYNVNENLVLRANINNLTDKKYWLYEDVRDFSSTSNNLDRYTQPGRNFNISATYTF